MITWGKKKRNEAKTLSCHFLLPHDLSEDIFLKKKSPFLLLMHDVLLEVYVPVWGEDNCKGLRLPNPPTDSFHICTWQVSAFVHVNRN